MSCSLLSVASRTKNTEISIIVARDQFRYTYSYGKRSNTTDYQNRLQSGNTVTRVQWYRPWIQYHTCMCSYVYMTTKPTCGFLS